MTYHELTIKVEPSWDEHKENRLENADRIIRSWLKEKVQSFHGYDCKEELKQHLGITKHHKNELAAWLDERLYNSSMGPIIDYNLIAEEALKWMEEQHDKA